MWVTTPQFATLDPAEIAYGRADAVSPTIRRVIAENPSKFTYLGTGTYIVGDGPVVVIDPGPVLDSHRDALAAALRGHEVMAILITHCHSDHSPLAAWLAAETGAPTVGFGPHPRPTQQQIDDERTALEAEAAEMRAAGETVDEETNAAGVKIEETTDYDFVPDIAVGDGDIAWSGGGLEIRAVYTPGHTSNHLCFAYTGERALFTGDHVMGWSTTVVSEPDGDMAAYMESLRRVADRDDAVLWPTHGPARHDAASYVDALHRHRVERERQIIELLQTGERTIAEIVEVLYADVRRELHRPARRSVHSHLVKSVGDGTVAVVDGDRPLLMSTYAAV